MVSGRLVSIRGRRMTLNPNCSELVFKLDEKIKTKREALEKLAKIGIYEVEIDNYYDYSEESKKEKVAMLVDEDNPNLPDFEYHAGLTLDKDPEGFVISFHQHCQAQGFPTLDKIERKFDGIWQPNDGGGLGDYEMWDGKIGKGVLNKEQKARRIKVINEAKKKWQKK